MALKLYIETTIVSFCTARPSQDWDLASLQRRTIDWWQHERKQFVLYTSVLTRFEAAAGDRIAAAARLDLIKGIPILEETDNVQRLSNQLVQAGAFPAIAARDASHVAICAINGIDLLLTWNFKHLANVFLRDRISDVCRMAGFEPPIICTPNELREVL